MRKSLLLTLAALSVFSPSHLSAAEPLLEARGIARGLMLFHDGKMIFSPCNERSYVVVDDVSPGGEVTSALNALGQGRSQPLYVELYGVAEHGMLRAEALNLAHVEARCHVRRRNTASWQGVGTDVGWTLAIEGDVVAFAPAGEAPRAFPVATTRETADLVRLEGGGKGGDSSSWDLRRGLCYRLGDGLVTGWTIEGRTDEGRVAGCAWRP